MRRWIKLGRSYNPVSVPRRTAISFSWRHSQITRAMDDLVYLDEGPWQVVNLLLTT
jgi:hypothetical protein